LIAASLPNPLKLDSAHPSRYLMRRQKAVMTQMKHVPLFTAKKD
jgi:monofunctional biosynthetic peptidoglycan transglycosylase